MKKFLFVLISCSFLMAQCHKEANNFIKVSGKVLEFGSTKPIANAKVGIYEEGGAFLGTTWTKLVDSTHTDVNGFYNIDKPNIDVGSSFYISAAAEKYYTFEPTKYLSTGKAVTNEIILDPFAWIKIHVKNVNPFDTNDKIIINGSTYTGKNFEQDFTYKIIGNKNFSIEWSVQRNNISTSFSDSTKVVAHDTSKYEIRY
jgi:hypothetical protein